MKNTDPELPFKEVFRIRLIKKKVGILLFKVGSGAGCVFPRNGSEDPDQNEMDSKHWFKEGENRQLMIKNLFTVAVTGSDPGSYLTFKWGTAWARIRNPFI